MTFRQKVDPSNPNTPEQQTQRSIFSDAVAIVKAIGPSIYQTDWNRSVGQLPGFQSLMSIIMGSMSSTGILSPPPDVALGDLHYPDAVAFPATGGAGEIDVTWTTELGANGTAADNAVLIVVPRLRADRDPIPAFSLTGGVRSDGAATVVGLPAASSMIVGLYFEGEGTAEGLLSLAEFSQEASG